MNPSNANLARTLRRVLFVLPVVLARGGLAAPPDPPPPPTGTPPASAAALRRMVLAHLEAGRIEPALLAAQEALEGRPDDPSIRSEFISLHLSLARQKLLLEDFATTGVALRAVARVQPDHPEARRILERLDSAAASAPGRVEQARRWLKVEWYEPAFRTFGQAVALVPDRAAEWRDEYLAAAEGAGDDHYFTKNFHEAFYYFDAVVRLSADTKVPLSPALASRWLQSMAHALGSDIGRVDYPPAYWRAVFARVDRLAAGGREGKTIRTLLKGFMREDLGELAQAAEIYGGILNRPIVTVEDDLVSRAREDALKTIRQWYDPRLSARRGGIWQDAAETKAAVLETPRFRIFHQNEEVAGRVAGALDFHFGRIASALTVNPARFPWARKCDVRIHPTLAAFSADTGQRGQVQATSVVQLQGGRLESHAIHVYQSDPLLLSTTLAHELAHLMVSAAANYKPIPPAVDEGFALWVEPSCRQVQFDRLFRQMDQPRSLTALLAIKDVHPSESAFYAEALRLVTALLSRGRMDSILELGGDAQSPKKLAARCGFRGAQQLQKAYLADHSSLADHSAEKAGPPD